MSTGPNMKHRNTTVAAEPLMGKTITCTCLVDFDDMFAAGRSAFERDWAKRQGAAVGKRRRSQRRLTYAKPCAGR